MNVPPLTIRIHSDEGQDMDWMVQPDEVTFRQTLEVVCQVVHSGNITAFEYEDEDEDRITVRSEDEMKEMIENYFHEMREEDRDRGLFPPLIIYPKMGKTAQRRNMLGLTVKTTKSAVTPSTTSPVLPSNPDQHCNHGDQPAMVVSPTPGLQNVGVQGLMSSPTPGLVSSQGRVTSPAPGFPSTQGPSLISSTPPGLVKTPPTGLMSTSPGMVTSPDASSAPPMSGISEPTGDISTLGVQSSLGLQQYFTNGDITDQIQKIECLGSGSGGRVYRSVHVPSGMQVALKEIQVDISPENQKQILVELDVLHKCNCRAIIAFYGAFFLENRISICTEYMDGGSLERYVPVPEPVLGKMAVYILEGLVYMWSLKILHRDIKPSNVLVSTKGEVKLCDFGVSTQLVKSIATTFVGTNIYMAPERLKGDNYGIPAEVWSVGVSLFELATAKIPFQKFEPSMKPLELMHCIIYETPLMLSQEFFSPEFVGFVASCMLKDPTKRLTPKELVSHVFVQRHADGNMAIIADYVCRCKHQRLLQPT